MAPVLVMSSASVLLMLIISFVRSHALAFLLGLAAVMGALAASLMIPDSLGAVTSLFMVDVTTHFLWALILLALLVCMVMSYDYIAPAESFREEWYLLMLVSGAGAMVLVASQHMVGLFVGLELMTVPLYGLVAFSLRSRHSLEAGIKYLVLSRRHRLSCCSVWRCCTRRRAAFCFPSGLSGRRRCRPWCCSAPP